MSNKERVIEYCNGVLDGRICAGQYIKLACKRFLNDLQRTDIYFNEKKLDTLVKLGKCLHHYKGDFNGKPFILEDWQLFISANIFCWYFTENNKRRFIQSYTQIARKNGKTALTTLEALFAMVADGESGAEIIVAANTREQARIAFEMGQQFCKQLDPKQKELRAYRNEIKMFANDSRVKVISADASKQDGWNASFAILDEYGGAKDNAMKNVILSSMAMRSNPHLAMITTAYFNKSYPCYEFRGYCIDVLNGLKDDDTVFAAIYEMDPDDDWTDESVWAKANPNIGITVRKDYLEQQANTAKQNPTDEVGVKTKNLNVWCDSSETWIADEKIVEQTRNIDFSKFDKHKYIAYCGIDLGAVSDLTTVSVMLTDGNEYYFKTYYYLPKTALNDKANKFLYREWAKRGFLTVTNSNVTDYDVILADLKELVKELNIIYVGYDDWNATQFVINATQEGLPMYEYGQNMGNFNRPTKELERLILQGKLFINNNPIDRFCFANVSMRTDINGNTKPSKDSNDKKIDGVISMITALGVHLQYNKY